MPAPEVPKRQLPRGIYAVAWFVAPSLLLVGVVSAAMLWRSAVKTSEENRAIAERLAAAIQDPRLTYDTPFKNVRPEVQYVGSEACARCHRHIAKTYREHPMGRSLVPVADAPASERHGDGTKPLLE